jgi:uncharacterized spore protein YtfJ
MEVEDLFRRAGKYLTVRLAYGPSYDHDGVLMVPVAVVAGGAGGGTGGFGAGGDGVGSGTSGAGDSEGGGFGGLVYPVGVYVVRNGNVRFRPTIDFPFVAVWSLLLLRFAFRVLRYLRDS